ncbi:glycoside hydrolase family 2 protein [Viscerimonas tarda]
MRKKLVFILVSIYSLSMSARQTETLYLSGTGSDNTVLWDFYCTAGNKSGKWTKIPVPSNWEFQGFGQFAYGHDKERLNESGLYRYKFRAPANWKDKQVNIVFEGSMTDTEVKINGKSAGEMHQGAFYCFRYDISELLNFGKDNLLEVSVHKSSSNKSIENAERNADFWVFGGIFRPVWLEALPQTHIERLAIDAQCTGAFRMDVFLGNTVEQAEISAQLKTLDGKAFGDVIRQTVTNADSLRLSANFPNPKLWTSEFPNRYMVEVSVVKDGKILHAVTEKFGFRTAELRPGDGFYVNGAKVKFKGVNRHTHWPTTGRASNYSLSLTDVQLIKEMNMNAVRMSHYPPDRHFLEVCDSLGLFVIDELTGWQSAYDTNAGKKLVKELILRDVNHPSVVMWANGNEGGFNFELLPNYPRYDIQKRLVIHPWLEEENVNTHHYISYGVGAHFFFEGNKVFYPTEFLHGLYDGGHGAGLDDFWRLMYDNPLSAGGFLWDYADQGVVRNDKNNEMDTDGDHAADGIVGPYREKEGSFYAIKEIWSPVYLEGTNFLPLSFDGQLKVQNRYHFTQLSQCRFEAKWIRFDYAKGTNTALPAAATLASDVAPGFSGILKITKPEDLKLYDALYVTAFDPYGKEIYTWSRNITPAKEFAKRLTQPEGISKPEVSKTSISIDKTRGIITEIKVGEKILPLANGPRFTSGDMEITEIKDITNGGAPATQVHYKKKGDTRKSTRNTIQISLLPSDWIEISYSFDIGGAYDHIGVTFDFPEDKVQRVKWLGNGPYRVWKNRMKGVTFNIWEKAYNNTVTGESWEYPEFKGFYSNLYAADLYTDEGVIKFVAADEDLFLHLFTPDKPVKRGNDNTLGKFPDGQLSILNAISPVGSKFRSAEGFGPQSQKNLFASSSHAEPLRGTFYIKYIPK